MSNHDKCLRILKTYGVLVDFRGKCKENAGKGKLADETLAAWKSRVLGDEIEDFVIYIPTEVAPQKRMKSLRDEGGASHINRIFSELTSFVRLDVENKLSEKEKELMDQYSTVPKRTLTSVVNSLEEDIEPSVREFFDRFLEKKNKQSNTKDLLLDLTKAYNDVVKQFRALSQLRSADFKG